MVNEISFHHIEGNIQIKNSASVNGRKFVIY